MSFLCHAVCLLTVNSDRLRSAVWKVASADSSALKVVVLKREHSVPSTAASPLTGACCYSLTPPCVKANSEALFKKQLLRCTISWNDPLTFLPPLISKQRIMRRTRADCTAHFFQSKKPAPQIPVRPKRKGFPHKVGLQQSQGAGSLAPSSHLLMERGKRPARARRWTGQGWGEGCPSSASLGALSAPLLQEEQAQLSQDLRQRSCSTGW